MPIWSNKVRLLLESPFGRGNRVSPRIPDTMQNVIASLVKPRTPAERAEIERPKNA